MYICYFLLPNKLGKKSERFISVFALSFGMEEIGSKIRNLKNALFMESLPYIFTPHPVKPRSLERGRKVMLRNLSPKPRALARGAGFTDWQIKIIKKRLNKERLTNSEKVEFSCNIKKKIMAIYLLKDLNLILF